MCLGIQTLQGSPFPLGGAGTMHLSCGETKGGNYELLQGGSGSPFP